MIRTPNRVSPVRAIEISFNGKTGPCSATYLTQSSCPSSCPLKHKGCYAEYGHVGITTQRLNESGIRSARKLAQLEAEAIDTLSGRFDLRLHVVGDSKTDEAANIVAEASARFLERSQRFWMWQPRSVWSYTHAWKDVKRASWGNVSILASCETIKQAEEATDLHYATSIIVPEFASPSAYKLEGSDLKLLPCPHQTKGKQCVDCRLCLDADRLREKGLVIGFEPHAALKNQVRKTLLELTVLEAA